MADVPSVEVMYTADNERAIRAFMMRRIGPIRHLPLALMLFTIAAAILAGFAAASSVFSGTNRDITEVVIFAFVVAGFWGAVRSERLLDRRLDKDEPLLGQHERISLAQDGIHIVTAHSDTCIFWSSLKDVVVNKKHLFFMFGQTRGVVIDKRNFDSPDNAEAFAAEARRHIAPKAS